MKGRILILLVESESPKGYCRSLIRMGMRKLYKDFIKNTQFFGEDFIIIGPKAAIVHTEYPVLKPLIFRIAYNICTFFKFFIFPR
jgi:hypothetical protein